MKRAPKRWSAGAAATIAFRATAWGFGGDSGDEGGGL